MVFVSPRETMMLSCVGYSCSMRYCMVARYWLSGDSGSYVTYVWYIVVMSVFASGVMGIFATVAGR